MRFHSSFAAIAILFACTAHALPTQPTQEKRAPLPYGDLSGLTSGILNWWYPWPNQTAEQIEASRATARTDSPTTFIKGKFFDRFLYIFLENTNYDSANGQRKFIFLQ